MQLAIIQNPHVKQPKTLWNILDQEQTKDKEILDEKLDKQAFMKFKEQLSESRAIKVK